MTSFGKWTRALPALFVGLGAATALAADPAAKPTTKPYPLNTCIVSGEKLGGMGEPASLVHEGREVKFCCAGCIPDFKADPAKFLTKLDAAQKASTTQPATKPAADGHEGHNH